MGNDCPDTERGRHRTLEWTIKLEARSGWGDVETIEVGRLKWRVVGLTAGLLHIPLTDNRSQFEPSRPAFFHSRLHVSCSLTAVACGHA